MVGIKEGPLEALCILFDGIKGIQCVAANSSEAERPQRAH